MPSITVPQPVPKIAREFRLVSQDEDGTKMFRCVDAEGTETLTVRPDGSSFSYFIGVCLDCAFGTAPYDWPDCPHRDAPIRSRSSTSTGARPTETP
jgi:hypothetical protein